MNKSTSIKTLLLGLLALAVVIAAILTARSTLTDKDELRAHLKSRFADWTGGELLIEGATRVSIFPRTRIEVDAVSIGNLPQMAELQRVAIKSLRAEFGALSLLWGEPAITRLTLYEPKITLRDAATTSRPSSPATEPALVRALRRAPFSRLTIEQGKLSEVGGDVLDDVQANMTLAQTGAVALEGAFNWRDQTVSFGLQSEPPQSNTKTPAIPVQMTFSGELVNATINGTARLGIDYKLEGTLGLSLPDTRKFSRWMGVAIPDGTGLGPFTASGNFNWVGQRIAYDNGTFELDGNRAIGALALLYDNPTPKIDGTLALQTLNIDAYLAPPAGEEPEAAANNSDFEIDFPLLRHVNLDLRLSATQLRATPIEAGQTALTLTSKAGALSADVSILDLFGGRASGRLELDAAQQVPRLQLSATLSELASQSTIEAFSAESPVDGGIDVQLDVAGYGRKLGEWLDRVTGNFEITMSEGDLDFDLAKVMAEARQSDMRGWPAVRGATTRIEQLKAALALEGGSAHSETFAFQTGADKITGHGTIDIPSRRIDWRLDVPEMKQIEPAEPDEAAASLTHSLHIYGPWSDPTFRMVQKRAERGAPFDQRAGVSPPARAF